MEDNSCKVSSRTFWHMPNPTTRYVISQWAILKFFLIFFINSSMISDEAVGVSFVWLSVCRGGRYQSSFQGRTCEPPRYSTDQQRVSQHTQHMQTTEIAASVFSTNPFCLELRATVWEVSGRQWLGGVFRTFPSELTSGKVMCARCTHRRAMIRW